MKSQLEIRAGQATDLSALAELAATEYPNGEMSDVRFLDWEYFGNPSGNAIVTLAIDEGQRPAAQYIVLPVEVVAGNRILMASLSLNTLTRSGFRGRGLFTQTAEATYNTCRENGIVFTYGVPNKNSFNGFVQKLGFRHIGNLNLLVKPLSLFALLKLLFRFKAGKKGREVVTTFDNKFLKENSISPFDPLSDKESYNAFWNRWKNESRIVINKSIDYLTWRYFRSPIRKYHSFKLTEGGEMTAFLVLRMMYIYGVKACVIIDQVSLDPGHGERLLRSALSAITAGKPAIAFGASSGPGTETDLPLKASGFIRIPGWFLPQQLPVIIKSHHQADESPKKWELANWHFSFGDYDVF